jgi:hypothetical protein
VASGTSDLLVFNGVDADTGEYLRPPLPVDDLIRTIVARLREPDPPLVPLPVRGVIEDVDPRNLAETGWGVIFGPGVSREARNALRPLLEHRRGQAARRWDHLYQEYDLRPDRSAADFLEELGAGPGPVDPEVVPYYLLIVGAPDSVPFSFQYQLDVQHGVGRLWFERPEDYEVYARRVIAAETATPPATREAVFFGPAHPGEELTRLSSEKLVGALSSRLPGEARSGWTGKALLGAEASKVNLDSLLRGTKPPSLLFTAGHGLGLSAGNPNQRCLQGSLLCSEWPGPGSGKIQRHCYFAGQDLQEGVDLGGLISFHFACYSAGTPRWDTFAPREEREIAPEPFLAGLPLALLRKGALAVIGHIDRAWLYSFLWLHQRAQIGAFRSTLGRLLDGYPVGAAMEFFGQRYAEISAALTQALDSGPGQVWVGDDQLTKLWTANGDARSYVVLGDPAVRLGSRAPL